MNFYDLFTFMFFVTLTSFLILICAAIEKIVDCVQRNKAAKRRHQLKIKKAKQEKRLEKIIARNHAVTFKTALDFDKCYEEGKNFATIGLNINLKEGEK